MFSIGIAVSGMVIVKWAEPLLLFDEWKCQVDLEMIG